MTEESKDCKDTSGGSFGTMPGPILEPAIEHFDWLILVIGPLTARFV